MKTKLIGRAVVAIDATFCHRCKATVPAGTRGEIDGGGCDAKYGYVSVGFDRHPHSVPVTIHPARLPVVKLEERPPMEPQVTIIREGTCKHPDVTDDTIRACITKPWRDTTVMCDACKEWLYPHEDEDVITVYVGEPYGAGRDPAGRPSHVTNPEAWSE